MQCFPLRQKCRSHVSTLIALTTRAMLYPEPDGPIRIFLTNPISNLSWQQFFAYWLKIDPEKEKKPTEDENNDPPGPIAFNNRKTMAGLEALLKQVPKDDNSLDKLGYKVIKQLTKLSYDYESRFYQFYCLRITDSFAPITAGPGNDLDIREANWMLIEPHDAYNVMYMSTRYDQMFVGRLGNANSIDAITTKRGRRQPKNDRHAEILGKWVRGTSRFGSPDLDGEKITRIFYKPIPNPYDKLNKGNDKLTKKVQSHNIK